jgi:hypothetical protein
LSKVNCQVSMRYTNWEVRGRCQANVELVGFNRHETDWKCVKISAEFNIVIMTEASDARNQDPLPEGIEYAALGDRQSVKHLSSGRRLMRFGSECNCIFLLPNNLTQADTII